MTIKTPITLSSITPHRSIEYWSVCKVEELFNLPFMELVFQAASVHR